MSLAEVAKETVEIGNRGWYVVASGARVSIADGVARAVGGTRLYRPDDFERLGPPAAGTGLAMIEVSAETTGEEERCRA